MGGRERSSRAEDAPRIRDIPAPRKNPSAIGPLMLRLFAWPYRAALAGLFRIGVRAWQLTIASLLMNAAVGVLLLRGERLLPGLLLIPAGLLDIFDGGVARLRGEESRLGAFLDSVLDRVSDLLLFGCLYWSLAGLGQRTEAALALVTLVISLFVSHLRAEAEAAGVSLSEGLFQRLERYVALIIGLVVPQALLAVLAVLAVLGGVTILQRGWSAWHRLEGGTSRRVQEHGT
jgi:CDP-diacylglycerol---glycerol-3-phosphate 3-phosphatidyltransferase